MQPYFRTNSKCMHKPSLCFFLLLDPLFLVLFSIRLSPVPSVGVCRRADCTNEERREDIPVILVTLVTLCALSRRLLFLSLSSTLSSSEHSKHITILQWYYTCITFTPCVHWVTSQGTTKLPPLWGTAAVFTSVKYRNFA